VADDDTITRPGDDRPFTRVARWPGRHRLTAGDLRVIARNLDKLGYPDNAEVDVITPIAGDRRVVSLHVYDYQPLKENT
jgi:hypothetical protein